MGNPIAGIRIRAERKRLKFTQQEIADKVGVSRIAFANYESGNIQPSIETLIKLATEFGCSIDYLLCFSDIRERATPTSSNDIPKLIEHLQSIINASDLSQKKRTRLQTLLEIAYETINE